MNLTIDDPEGYPDTIADDLTRADFEYAEQCGIEYDEDTHTVEVTAPHSTAAKQLYDWLKDSVEHYRTEYVAAEMEHRAARQLERAVYQAFVDPEGSV
jgi:hypothetical protein